MGRGVGQRQGLHSVGLAVLAVLTLLMSPAVAGSAHAAMPAAPAPALTPAPAPAPAAMADMAGGPHVSAPCHHGSGACALACALASQLLAPPSSEAGRPVVATGRADYAPLDIRGGDAPAERSTPPPR